MSSSRFHAVSIRARSTACAAVHAIGEQRFLSAEAPSLPVPGCPQPQQCRCRYRHWEDRRQEPRRDADIGLPGTPWLRAERRGDRRGRRTTDRQAAR